MSTQQSAINTQPRRLPVETSEVYQNHKQRKDLSFRSRAAGEESAFCPFLNWCHRRQVLRFSILAILAVMAILAIFNLLNLSRLAVDYQFTQLPNFRLGSALAHHLAPRRQSLRNIQ